MSKELRSVVVYVTVKDMENLPMVDGERMGPDMVQEEVADLIRETVTRWYIERGHDLLACPPDMI